MSLLTKLEAVNLMLEAIGESPVSSLNSGVDDAEVAERILDRTTKDVQSVGWHCNKDYCIKFTPNTEGEIKPGATVLRSDSSGPSKGLNLVIREDRLYNVKDQTYTFTAPVYLDVVWNQEWDVMSYALRRYITARAAMKFQASSPASVSLDAFTSRDVTEAYQLLLEEEVENQDFNILRGNSHCVAMTYRRNNLYGV